VYFLRFANLEEPIVMTSRYFPKLSVTKVISSIILCSSLIPTSSIWASSEQITPEQEQLFSKRTNDSKEQRISGLRYGVKLTRVPTAVGNPNYSGTFTRFDEAASLTFWREDVDGAERLFVQVQPATGTSFFFCPGSQFSIIQNGIDFGQSFRVTRGDNGSVCQHLRISEIFLVDQRSSYTNFKEGEAFTISYAEISEYYSGTINVAASSTTTTSTNPSPVEEPPSSPVSNDCVADYNSVTGELHIPCVRVPGAFGIIDMYDVWLLQKPSSFTFDLDTNRINLK
jgi:hypothetical protein